MTLDFFIDTLIVVLLAATCGYCAVLSRRLARFRNGQDELLSQIKKFDEASLRAQRNLGELQTNSAMLSSKLSRSVKEARALNDELSVMIAAGDNIAQRIEEAAAMARGRPFSERKKQRRAA